MMKIPHLTTKTAVHRDGVNRAHRLNESGQPVCDGTAASVWRILDWLDVENKQRYKPGAGKTYCNIYAYDYACLMGADLPRVWWADTAKGDDQPVTYGVTVRELSANDMYDWFRTFGQRCGWKEVESNTAAQALANAGHCVIMVAANKHRERSGHIVAVVPEIPGKRLAVRANGLHESTILYPLMSQAGGRNLKYFSSPWWSGHEMPRTYVYTG